MGFTYKKIIKTFSETLISLATWLETQGSQGCLFLLNTHDIV